MAPSAPPSRVSPQKMEKALNALLKWRESRSKDQKPQLLEQDELVYLILTLKKIPQFPRVNAHKIHLPHPLINPFSDLCLIIDDRSKSGLTKDAAAKKISSENIPICKVIKLSKLKSDYRPFEAKRKLCDSYDLFFADKRIIPFLPKLLGKQFFKKKKIPVPLDLKHKNWKEQIENACSSGMLYLSAGTCSVVKVGKLSMEGHEILANVTAAIDGIAEVVPKKWGNIRSIHLKLLESLALPVYETVPDLRLKIEAASKEHGEIVDAEDHAAANEKNKKGRIHEVRYMDSNNISETLDEDEIGSDFDSEKNVNFGGKKRRQDDQLENKKEASMVAKLKKGDGGIKGEMNAKKMKKHQEEESGVEEEEEEEKTRSATNKLKSTEQKSVNKKKKKTGVAK